ncbi:MAG: M1 family metallopeptidase [Actinobacteria bacterium]|nr:M1 family metallopeptidase [Actinomycetota bacterium]
MTDRDPNRLPTTVTPHHYDLWFHPRLEDATFTGSADVEVTVHEPVDEIVLHALDLDIVDAALERKGERVALEPSFDAATETATLDAGTTIESGDWTLRLRFAGELNDKLVGFYRSTYTDDHGVERTLACTQFESTHARRAFPCWDEPAWKATYAITMRIAEDLFAVSNATDTSVERVEGGDKLVRFATTMSMSTYLVAMVVGPLEATEPVDVDGVPLRVVAPIGRGHLTGFALEVGAFALRYLADWYDIAYPGDKVDLVAVPDFSFGAMENLGCITFRETLLLVDEERATQAELQNVVDVIAHELAHMWFGDLVTMQWWEGIWLNEAFATFMEMMTTDAFRPKWQRWVDFGIARSMAFDTDSLSTTRPIEYEVVTAEDAEGMFDVLTYEKGASVVRMLQQYLGEDRFQAGIRHYLRTHAYGNTATTDLWDAIEEATGEPVRSIMDTWIFRPGHPVVSVERDGDALVLRQQRFGYRPDPAAGVTSPTEDDRAVPVVVRTGAGDATSTTRVLLDGPEGRVELEGPVDWVVGNHEGNGFYRVELSNADLAAVGGRALAALSPIERYGLVEDEWALLLAGRGSVARVTDVLRSLGGDDDLAVWKRMIAVLASLDRLVGDGSRADLQAWSRALLGPALHRLGPTRVDGEGDLVTALRATLTLASVLQGDDRHQVDLARDRFAAAADGPVADVDADLADAAVRIVASRADEATWEELRRRANEATTAQDRLRHQGALADAEDPALVMRFCDLVLTDEIRTQDGLFLLRRALSNRTAADQVWAFVEEHWTTLNERFPSASVPRMLEGVRTFGDRALAERVAAFLAEHPVPQGEQVIRQHVERMWVSVAMAERIPAELAAVIA